MSPTPAPVLKVAVLVSVTALKNEILRLDVVIDPAKETAPAPFCVKAPVRLIAVALLIVSVPEFVTVRGPPFVVVTFELNAKLVPVKAIPPPR